MFPSDVDSDEFDADAWLAKLGPDEGADVFGEPDWINDPRHAGTVPVVERLFRWGELPPAARPMDQLSAVDPAVLAGPDRVTLLGLLNEQRRWVDSLLLDTLAVMGAADASSLGLSGETASMVLRVPRREAQRTMAVASSLKRSLPLTDEALRRGEISVEQASAVAGASWKLADALLPDLEAAVLATAADLSLRATRDCLRRAATRLDPAAAEHAHQEAAAARAVDYEPLDDGMAKLRVLLPAPDAQAVFTRLTAAAALLPHDDPRGTDQQRADLLVDAVLSGIPHGDLPRLQGRRPSVHVVVSADTLLGLDDEPGHLTGHGPVTAGQARRLAADESGTWRRLLTDPDTGHLLDISPRTYRPSQRLRDFTAARDTVCTFPHCHQPAYRCEWEHITPRAQGGPTCRCNGALACKRHNLCLIDTGYHYQRNPDGTFTWTDDTGHDHTSHPPQTWTTPAEKAHDRRPPKTIADLHTEQDQAADKLIHRWQRQLAEAEQAGDPTRIATMTNALASAQHQHARQLQHRQNPSHPPF